MVLESVIYGLIAAVGFGGADFLVAIVSRKVGVLQTALAASILATAISTPYLPFAPGLDDLTLLLWGELAGISVLGVLVILALYKALQIGPVAIVAPITAAYAAVTVLLAVVFVGEQLSGQQTAAIAATIGGVTLASVNLQEIRSGSSLVSKGVMLGLVAAAGLGLLAFSTGVISRDIGWFLPAYAMNLMTFGILSSAFIQKREWPWKNLTKSIVSGAVLIGILQTAALFAFSRGSEIGVISIVSAASAAAPLLPVIGGLLILRERLAINQAGGLVLLMGGQVVLSLSA